VKKHGRTRTDTDGLAAARLAVALIAAAWLWAAAAAPANAAAPQKPILFGGRNVHDVTLITTGTLADAPDPTGVNEINYALLLKTRTGKPLRYDPKLVALDGLRVRLPGYMLPYDTYLKMTNFLLIYAPPDCPFCDPPLPTEYIFVRMKKGLTTDYLQTPVTIEGRLWLRGKGHDQPGLKEFFYVIDEAKVDKYVGP